MGEQPSSNPFEDFSENTRRIFDEQAQAFRDYHADPSNENRQALDAADEELALEGDMPALTREMEIGHIVRREEEIAAEEEAEERAEAEAVEQRRKEIERLRDEHMGLIERRTTEGRSHKKSKQVEEGEDSG